MTGAHLSPASSSLSEVKRKLLERYRRGDVVSGDRQSDRIIRRPLDEAAPLSLAQEQLWYREQVQEIPPLYNESITIRRKGPLDVSALQRCLTEIVRRHGIWRTVYGHLNGSPVQLVQPPPSSFPLQIVDLSAMDQAAAEAQILQRTTAETRRRFDLTRGPLLRATLFRISDEEYRLFIAAHLSIIDGISVYQVLPSEIDALYAAFSASESSPLPEPCIQYADYAYWQRRMFNGSERVRQLNYWRAQLERDPLAPRWPAIRSPASSTSYRGAMRAFTLNNELTAALKELSRREGVTLFCTILASLCALLHRYTGRTDLLIGTPSPAGRKRPETQQLLGYFLNPIALRIDLQGEPSLRDLLLRVQTVVAHAMCYDDLPLELLAHEMKLNSANHRNPFFDTAISLQPKTPAAVAGWDVTSMDVDSGGAPWGLYLAFIDGRNGMLGRAQYNPELFDPPTISGLLSNLQSCMTVLAGDPGRRLSAVCNRI